MYFDVLGRENRRGTVFMSSGLGGSAHYWKPQTGTLLENGFKVIVYDQLGTGRSRPASLPAGYSIGDMATEVIDLLDATGTRDCHFVGHALGGLVGLQLALDAPARLRSLTLVNAWSRISTHTERCFDARLALLDACGPSAYVRAQPIFLYPAAWADAHADAVANEVEHAIEQFPGAQTMRGRIGALRAFDVRAGLERIDKPVFVSASTDDVLVPWTQSRLLAEALPYAETEFVARGGHAHNVTEAEAFNRSLLAFLQKHA